MNNDGDEEVNDPDERPVEPRNVTIWCLVGFLTCGAGFLVWWVLIGTDLVQLRADTQEKPHIAKDLLLSFVTCGLWRIFTDYRWAWYLNEEKREAGLRTEENFPTMVILFDVFSFSLLSTPILQLELNRIVNEREDHRGLG